MSDATAPSSSRGLTPERALGGLARLWFLILAVGQILFIYFIVAFYGTRTVSGAFERWNEKPLIDGHIPDDTAGNLLFAGHALLAAIIAFGSVFQLVSWIRARAGVLHRWNGRLFMVVSAILAISGLVLVWWRGTYLSIYGALGITLDAILILVFGAIAWSCAANRKFDAHRRWALRTLMAVSGVWFLRVGFMAWAILTGGAGMTRNMDGAFDIFWVFGNYLVPLALLELFFWAQRAHGAPLRWPAIGLLFAMTLLMALGVFGTQAFMWGPYL